MVKIRKMNFPEAIATGIAAEISFVTVAELLPAVLLDSGILDSSEIVTVTFMVEWIALFVTAGICIRARGRHIFPMAMCMGCGVLLISVVLCVCLHGAEDISGWLISQTAVCLSSALCASLYGYRRGVLKKQRRR